MKIGSTLIMGITLIIALIAITILVTAAYSDITTTINNTAVANSTQHTGVSIGTSIMSVAAYLPWIVILLIGAGLFFVVIMFFFGNKNKRYYR